MSEGATARTCRSCGASYEFPRAGSAATRASCPDCAPLPIAFRRVLERLQRRIERLERQVPPGTGRP